MLRRLSRAKVRACCWKRLDRTLRKSPRMSAYDPTATLPVRCGNGFHAGFTYYQSTRLNRYDAVS